MIEPSGPEVVVLPLGGCGEVGLNATLIIDGQDVLLIDCGALLGVENAPGVEKAVPGFEPLFTHGRRLCGVVLTHGHEDHIGGLPALLAQLDTPVFGTPLTMALVRSRLEGSGGAVPDEAKPSRARLTEVPLGGVVSIGPFEIEFVRVTHSLPDSAALAIQTRAGRILHSGDFKLDHTPSYGEPTDVERLRAIGDEGVQLLLADSTNSEVPGRAGSEGDVSIEIDRLIGESEGRVVVSLFASHLHRVRAVVDAAKKHGRRIALLGRALERTWRIGVERKELPNDPTLLVAAEHLAGVDPKHIVVLATGSQGEWQGGLARLAEARHASLRLDKTDRVILSTRAIPGNERAVSRLRNHFVRQGIEVVNHRMAAVHCSGHAHREEQAEMFGLLRPKNFIPVHGERTMLDAHDKTARQHGVDRTLVIEDGQPVVLTGGTIHLGEPEPISRRALDSNGRMMDWGDVTDRNRIGRRGLLFVSMALDEAGRPAGTPAVTTRGRTLRLVDERAVRETIDRVLRENAQSAPDLINRRLRSQIRSVLKDRTGLSPEVEVVLVGLKGPETP